MDFGKPSPQSKKQRPLQNQSESRTIVNVNKNSSGNNYGRFSGGNNVGNSDVNQSNMDKNDINIGNLNQNISSLVNKFKQKRESQQIGCNLYQWQLNDTDSVLMVAIGIMNKILLFQIKKLKAF